MKDRTSKKTTKRQPLTSWQTEPCPSWCVVKHLDGEHPDDRRHLGRNREITMRGLPAVKWRGDDWAPSVLRIHLDQHVSAAEPTFAFMVNDGGADEPREPEFTPTEWRSLIAEMTSALEETGS